MPDISLPSVTAYGNITKALNALIDASTPQRFTQDFLSTKLNMPGGSAKPVIPFFKKTGLLGSDGTPTELYNQFRNADLRGAAAARALRNGYAPLYAFNEYLQNLDDTKLKNVIVQATGQKPDAAAVKVVVGSFKALREFADFDAELSDLPSQPHNDVDAEPERGGDGDTPRSLGDLRLGYTINLNLPATTDVEVFNAIFSSLKQHLLQ